jgi:hypothetical protein
MSLSTSLSLFVHFRMLQILHYNKINKINKITLLGDIYVYIKFTPLYLSLFKMLSDNIFSI